MTLIYLKDGDRTFTLRYADPHDLNPIVTESYNLGRPTARTVIEDASGQSGTYDLTTEYGARTISLRSKILNTPSASKWQTIDEIASYTAPGQRPYLHVMQDGWTEERRILVATDDFQYEIGQQNTSFMDVELTFRGPRGVFESAAQTVQTLGNQSGTVGGRAYPQIFPFNYTPGYAGTASDTVTNNGSIAANPILRIYGYAVNPTVINNTTLQRLRFNTTIPAGSYLEVNVAARTVLMNGDSSQDYWGTQDFNQSTVPYFRLRRGANLMGMVSQASDSGAQLQVIYRPTYI